MRVIAGTLKGRRLSGPTWAGLRPTSDKLRETLFNILAPRVAGARVLDAYAGTGALGVEALSRGAAEVTFVESDRRAQALIAENLARCGITDRHVIIRASVARVIDTLGGHGHFDLVLADPPYTQQVDAIVDALSRLVAPGGLLVVEHPRRRPTPDIAGGFARTRELIAGESALAFYACQP